MNSIMSKSIMAALAYSASSWAIFGIGGHYTISGMTTESIDQTIYEQIITNPAGGSDLTLNAIFNREEAKGLKGFGLKVWIDALPFVDIEATANFSGSTYATSLTLNYPNEKGEAQQEVIPLELDIPGQNLFTDKPVNPGFGAMLIDLTVSYPFFELPLPVIEWSLYAGGGLTYAYHPPLITKELATTIATNILSNTAQALESGNTVNPEETAKQLTEALIDAVDNESIHSGIGGHAIFGTRFSILFVPLAIYANGKYHFGGVDTGVKHGLTWELGGGLAF